MVFPKIQLQSEEVLLSDGSAISVTGLTRKQAIEMGEAVEDMAKLEISILKNSTGASQKEAEAWYEQAPSADVQKIIEVVMRLSGMDEQTPKA